MSNSSAVMTLVLISDRDINIFVLHKPLRHFGRRRLSWTASSSLATVHDEILLNRSSDLREDLSIKVQNGARESRI